MNSRLARLLWALSAAVLLHGGLLMLRFQAGTTVPVPYPIQRITVSLAAFQSSRSTADTEQNPDVPQSAPETAPAPPVEQTVVEPSMVKSAPEMAPKNRKNVTQSVPSPRKKTAAPPVKAKTLTENAPKSTATSEDVPSQRKSGSTADAVVVKAVPIYRDNPPPRYPPLAKRRGLEGTIFIEALVSTTGRVLECGISRSSGHRLLDQSALKAVNRWSFTSGTVNGRPEEMRVVVPVHFTLR